MKKSASILFLFIGLFSLSVLHAQKDTLQHSQAADTVLPPALVHKPNTRPKEAPSPFMDKVYYGGNIGLGFGNWGYLLNLNPLIGYRITERFSAGVTGTYLHYKFNTPYGSFENNIYGAGIFSRYFITENIFAHVETDVLNGEWTDRNRFNIYPVLVGGGYRSRIGSRASMLAMVLYDINYSIYSPSGSPISFVIGFGVGF
jgi:hypothetical protein